MKIHVFLNFSHPKNFKTGKKLCNILDLLIYSSFQIFCCKHEDRRREKPPCGAFMLYTSVLSAVCCCTLCTTASSGTGFEKKYP